MSGGSCWLYIFVILYQGFLINLSWNQVLICFPFITVFTDHFHFKGLSLQHHLSLFGCLLHSVLHVQQHKTRCMPWTVWKSNKQSHCTLGRTPTWQYSPHHDQRNLINKHLRLDACVYTNVKRSTQRYGWVMFNTPWTFWWKEEALMYPG